MKITIFGATGRTGQTLLQQALQAGHEVTVLVRSPQKLTLESDQLTVVRGDIGDALKVDLAVNDSQAVLSVLGPASNEPIFAISEGMKHIISSMNARGVRRLIISAGAAVEDANDTPRLTNKVIGFMVRTISANVYEDMVRTVQVVRSSDLDWTIVRVPMLADGPPKGAVKVGYLGRGVGPRITRSDLAAFMLQQLQSQEFVHQAPAISN